MFKIRLLALTFVTLAVSTSFAADTKYDMQPESQRSIGFRTCELLLINSSSQVANLELNHQLQSQLRSEAFLKSMLETTDEAGVKKVAKELVYLNTFMNSDSIMQESLFTVLNKSIVGFERHGFQSKGYIEKGLSEEDGVLYIVHHPDYRTSYIVLSRVSSSLDGMDPDAFAEGDLKLGNLPGKTDDLSAISVEIFTEDNHGMLNGTRHVQEWFDTSAKMRAFRFEPHSIESWEHWWTEKRIGGAAERDVVVREPHIWGINYMKDEN